VEGAKMASLVDKIKDALRDSTNQELAKLAPKQETAATSSTLPKWILPVGIGGVVLAFLMYGGKKPQRRRK
jgi:hypothetical protein